MLRTLDANSETFLNNLNRISDQMSRAQREISTGLRVAAVSDDPDQVSTILQARADLASMEQTGANLSRVKAEVDTGEQSLQSAVALMERARTLGAQGNNTTASSDSRAALADEVGAILEQMGGLSRTTVEGRYIFGGDADQQAPYTIDLSQANPISSYDGSESTRQVQHPNGTRFRVARTAQEIFDAPAANQNVFVSLRNLRAALLSNDQSAIGAALQDVTTANTYLNSQLSFYGSVQNKVAEATDFGDKHKLQLQAHINGLQDADLTEAILELSQGQMQQNAALQARAKMPNTSLFDYLK